MLLGDVSWTGYVRLALASPKTNFGGCFLRILTGNPIFFAPGGASAGGTLRGSLQSQIASGSRLTEPPSRLFQLFLHSWRLKVNDQVFSVGIVGMCIKRTLRTSCTCLDKTLYAMSGTVYSQWHGMMRQGDVHFLCPFYDSKSSPSPWRVGPYAAIMWTQIYLDHNSSSTVYRQNLQERVPYTPDTLPQNGFRRQSTETSAPRRVHAHVYTQRHRQQILLNKPPVSKHAQVTVSARQPRLLLVLRCPTSTFYQSNMRTRNSPWNTDNQNTGKDTVHCSRPKTMGYSGRYSDTMITSPEIFPTALTWQL